MKPRLPCLSVGTHDYISDLEDLFGGMGCGDAAQAEFTQELLCSMCSRNKHLPLWLQGGAGLALQLFRLVRPSMVIFPCSYQKEASSWLWLELRLSGFATSSSTHCTILPGCLPAFRCECIWGWVLILSWFFCRPSSLAALSLPA